jgi:lysozyme family protein
MAEFQPAFEFMMDHEDATRSGVVTHDEDGRTRFGICERFHAYMTEEFWNGPATEEMAVAARVYEQLYWNRIYGSIVVDQAVASKFFDMSVNMGVTQATLLAQRAANGLLMGSSKAPVIDGIVGDKTISSLNTCPPDCLVETLCNLSKIFFAEDAAKHPEKQKNLAGWMRRAGSVPPHAWTPARAVAADA